MMGRTVTIDQWIQGLRRWIGRERQAITGWRGWEGEAPGAQRPEFDDRSWLEMGVGSPWGQRSPSLWLRGTVAVPPAWQTQPCALCLELSPWRDDPWEALLYVNGVATQGLDGPHAEVLLTPQQKTAGLLHLALQARRCFRPGTGLADLAPPGLLTRLDLVRLDRSLEDLYYTLRVALDLAQTLDRNPLLQHRLLDLLAETRRRMEGPEPGSEAFYRRAAEVQAWLQEQESQLQAHFGQDVRPVLTGIGFAPAGLGPWETLSQARWEMQRTFSTALHLMQHYPEFCFFHPGALGYRWVQEDDPELFARLRSAVSAGRWEIAVGIGPEAELLAGESLVRQLQDDRRFFSEQLGSPCEILWLPEAGPAWEAWPQLLRRSGLKWGITGPRAHPGPAGRSSWRGIDGTEAEVYSLPAWPSAGPDSSGLTARHLQEAWQQGHQQAWSDEILLAFGSPQGPTREMLEYARRLQRLPGPFDFQIDTIQNFFQRLPDKIEVGREVEAEIRRTAEAPLRLPPRAYREREVLLHNAELFATIAAEYGGVPYPHRELRRSWAGLLGVPALECGAPAPPDSRWEATLRLGAEVLDRALAGLAGRVNLTAEALLVFNPCSWVRTDTVAVPWEDAPDSLRLLDPGGQEVAYQVASTAEGTELVFTAEDVPACGYRAYWVIQEQADEVPLALKRDYGPLTMLLNDPAVTHIQVQSPFQIFAERSGRLEIIPEHFRDEAHLRSVAERWAEMLGGILDEAHPELDQMWPDGTRFRIQIPPRSLRGTLITIWRGKGEEDPLLAVEARYIALAQALSKKRQNPFKVNPRRLENDFFRLTLNDFGQIIDLYDKRQNRDVFPPDTPGNVLRAGGVGEGYGSEEILTRLLSAEVRETGPERGAVELTWRYRTSQVQQRILLYRAVPRIDFVTEVDWQEPRRGLQVVFPVDLQARQATWEIPFGNTVRRIPRHRRGVPETGAQKWIDLSEGDYGVSLLNDGLYGHEVYPNGLLLTLVDPVASGGALGGHRFTYSLYPHPEDWSRGGTVYQAYQLNYPLLVRREPAHAGDLPASYSFVSVDAEHVILETIKRAEEDGGWIVRAYEWANRRSPVTLTFCQPLSQAAECDLLEGSEQSLKPRGRTLECFIRPYEVKTFKVKLRTGSPWNGRPETPGGDPGLAGL